MVLAIFDFSAAICVLDSAISDFSPDGHPKTMKADRSAASVNKV